MDQNINNNQIPDFRNFTEHSRQPLSEAVQPSEADASTRSQIASPVKNTRVAIAIAATCLVGSMVLLQLILSSRTRATRQVPPLVAPIVAPTKPAK